MKRTRSMIIAPSQEARELAVYTANHYTEKYYKQIKSVVANLKKHYKRGNYSADRAIDAYYPIICEASKEYFKDFGYAFTVTERFNAAIELEHDFFEDVEEA